MRPGREHNLRAVEFHGIHRAEHTPAFLYGAILLGGPLFSGSVLVLERIAFADGTEDIRHISLLDELLCAEDEQLSVLNDARNLGCVIQTFGAFGHAEFGLYYIKKFLDVGNGVTGIVEVNDLLRFHRPGALGGCHIYYCGVLVCHLLTGKQIDERVGEPYEITVSRALLQFADGGMVCFRERVVPVAEDSLCLRGSGGGEKVCDTLQNIAQRLRGYGVFGL